MRKCVTVAWGMVFVMLVVGVAYASDLEVNAEGPTAVVGTSDTVYIPVTVTYKGEPVQATSGKLSVVMAPPLQSAIQPAGPLYTGDGLYYFSLKPDSNPSSCEACPKTWRKGKTIVRIKATYNTPSGIYKGETLTAVKTE